MRKLLVVTTLFLLSVGCSTLQTNVNTSCSGIYNTAVSVGSKDLCARILNTPAEMQRGLSGRESMGEHEGMIFDFSTEPSTPTFWMKDMKFDIDMVWIKNNKVIAVTKSVPYPRNAEENQNDRLPNYSPPSAVDYVLEVNAGWAEKNNVTVGSDVKLPN